MMKKIFFILGIVISLSASAQFGTLNSGATGIQLRTIFNDNFDIVQDTNNVHRGLIDLNYGWIYDIMNDSLPDLRTAIAAASQSGSSSGGETDTTSLSNRIDELKDRLNDTISFDTSSVTTDFLMRDDPFIAAYGLGSGQDQDTGLFVADALCGWFRNDTRDTIVIDSCRNLVLGTSASIAFDVCFDDTLNAVFPTKATSSSITVTNTNTGVVTTTFANEDIPPGRWVYFKITEVTTKPKLFAGTLIYHYK